MKPALNILWWATYIIIALILQQQLPRLDALTPGFLITLQERNTKQTLWLFLLFMLIQEGTGSLTFGMGLLWYGGQICIFQLSSRLFMFNNPLSVSMLSIGLCLYYSAILWLMCALQDIPMDYVQLLYATIPQAISIPIIWVICRFMRPLKVPQHAY